VNGTVQRLGVGFATKSIIKLVALETLDMDIILALFLLLLFALILGELFEKFNFPSIIGEILAGVILGPAVLDFIKPNSILSGFSEIALFFIVLLIGVELTTESLRKHYRISFLFTLTSFIVPVTVMILVSIFLLHLSEETAIIISVSIGVPSISIISVITNRLGLLSVDDGNIIIASVVITDISAFVVVSAFLGKNIYIVVLALFIFLLLLLVLDHEIRKHSDTVANFFRKIHAADRGEKIIFGAIILGGLVISTLFEFIGITYVLGAFFAGLIISDVVVGKSLQGILTRTLTRLDDSFFIPVFFSIDGLSAVIPSSNYIIDLAVLLSVTAAIGGILDFYLGRNIFRHMKGKTSSGIFGGRGAVGIVIATVAFNAGILSKDLFSVAIFATIFISLIFSFFVNRRDVQLSDVKVARK